jgi:hypothetical protein
MTAQGSLILKGAPIGDNQEDDDVLKGGVIVGRIFFLSAVAPQGRPWMWASGHKGDIRRRSSRLGEGSSRLQRPPCHRSSKPANAVLVITITLANAMAGRRLALGAVQ